MRLYFSDILDFYESRMVVTGAGLINLALNRPVSASSEAYGGTATRRDDRRERRRALLLDTAMEILVEGGLEALTIPRLAERMDASVGGLYRYFPSKEAIFVALQERAIDGYAQAQRDAVSGVEARHAGLDEVTMALIRVVASFGVLLTAAERLVQEGPSILEDARVPRRGRRMFPF